MADIRRQELYCHECENYVQFDMDLEINGNHVLTCPNCGHEHCRVVKDGEITEDRWDRRNGQIIPISNATTTWSNSSTYSTYITVSTSTNTSSTFLYTSWMDTLRRTS